MYGRIISEAEYMKYKDVLGDDICWKLYKGRYVNYLVVDENCIANYLNAADWSEELDDKNQDQLNSKKKKRKKSKTIDNCYAYTNPSLSLHDDACVTIRAKHDIEVPPNSSVELILNSYNMGQFNRCDTCNSLFSCPFTLRRHKLNTKCNPVCSHRCKHCHETFQTVNQLKKHEKKCKEYVNPAVDGSLSYLLNRIPFTIDPLDLLWFKNEWDGLAHPAHVLTSYNSRSKANPLMKKLEELIGGSYLVTKTSACSSAETLPSMGLYCQENRSAELDAIDSARKKLPVRIWYLHGMYLGDFGRPGAFGSNVR